MRDVILCVPKGHINPQVLGNGHLNNIGLHFRKGEWKYAIRNVMSFGILCELIYNSIH